MFVWIHGRTRKHNLVQFPRETNPSAIIRESNPSFKTILTEMVTAIMTDIVIKIVGTILTDIAKAIFSHNSARF